MPQPLPVTRLEPPTGEILVLSDWHLSQPEAAVERTRQPVHPSDVQGTIAAFLDDLAGRLAGSAEKAMLVVNGDLFDFDSVRRVPRTEADFRRWHRLLQRVGRDDHTPASLRAGVAPHERRQGLDPFEHKSVWKISVVFQENRPVLQRLARLLADGVRLVILRGNHDTELYWPAVRQAVRVLLAEVGPAGADAERFDRIVIAPYAVQIGEAVHAEHGHQYEQVCRVDREMDPQRPGQLSLSMGAWYVRRRPRPEDPDYEPVGPLAGWWSGVLERLVGALYPIALALLLILPARLVDQTGWYVSDARRQRSRRQARRPRPWWKEWLWPRTLHIRWLRRLSSYWLTAQLAHLPRCWPRVRWVLTGHTHWPCRRRLGQRCVLLNTGCWLPQNPPNGHPEAPGGSFTFARLRRDGADWQADLYRWERRAGQWRRLRQ